jgi:ATP-dependent RNA helicase DDX54/DBP10
VILQLYLKVDSLEILNMRSFRNGEVSYMIVTDLAARGIDVPLLNNVINYHFPPSPKLFVHRCGRAARQVYFSIVIM